MAILRIYNALDPVLRKKAAQVENIDGELAEFTQDMIETMYDAPGVGLAANQVGLPSSLFVIDMGAESDKPDPKIIINPTIIVSGDMLEGEEGCLSIPDLFASVMRSSHVELKGYDLDQKEIRIEAEGFMARAIQHEMEHLNGSLFWDNLGKTRRDMLKRKFKKKLKENR
ncbi:MAG: peptide deformylase [Candidatus Nitrohelix vancouverensis]|uniref:Peptide deformylase n=1 Tax=Candidatus Nitrohelix vancouverensis TaxID=2705534 RepID=A0A7T0G235_9BACT|nr:MAG: peptide deformylase [Candidatus Nitrohelix vancouverensis]